MKKICFVTGSRAEYGLLKYLMLEFKNDPSYELQIIACCMHLSPEFGLTYKEIEKDGFVISRKVEMLLSSDTENSISKSMGLGNIGFADAYESLNPDLLVVLGDRFEILSAVSVALIYKIPVAHLHGGEITEGAFDDSIRHAITKMSHYHFTANQQFTDRVIQMGEMPERVFTVGGLGVDAIKHVKLLSRDELEKSLGKKLLDKNILVTFHPVTLENKTAIQQFESLLKALEQQEDTLIIFTKPNADTDGRIISKMIDEYVQKYPGQSVAFTSLGQQRYFSALKYIDLLLGNSSSGLAEMPTFQKPSINIGNRQGGRLKAKSVIDCEPTVEGITTALKKAYDPAFLQSIRNVENPYGTGGAATKIKNILSNLDLTTGVIKKFYALNKEQ